MTKLRKAVLLAPLLFAVGFLPANAQDNRGHNNFNNGMRQGGRGGSYYNGHNNYNGSDNRNRRDQGGIGPGKGALIGAGGGALLGAVFGGGLKGTIVGGAAGAGIGAVIGGVAQNNRRDRNGRPY
jgi:hypothetical protein